MPRRYRARLGLPSFLQSQEAPWGGCQDWRKEEKLSSATPRLDHCSLFAKKRGEFFARGQIPRRGEQRALRDQLPFPPRRFLLEAPALAPGAETEARGPGAPRKGWAGAAPGPRRGLRLCRREAQTGGPLPASEQPRRGQSRCELVGTRRRSPPATAAPASLRPAAPRHLPNLCPTMARPSRTPAGTTSGAQSGP